MGWFHDIFEACWPDVFEACWPRDAAAAVRSDRVDDAAEVRGAVHGGGMRVQRSPSASSERLPFPPGDDRYDDVRRAFQQECAAQSFRGIVEVAAGRVQANAAPDAIFFLRKDVNDEVRPYRMEESATGRRHVPDGLYVFVLPEDAVGEVVCGVSDLHKRVGGPPKVAGHAGLARQQRVLFAGHLYFADGALTSWSNESGHYQFPAAAGESCTLPPHIRELLLPRELYAPRINFVRHSY